MLGAQGGGGAKPYRLSTKDLVAWVSMGIIHVPRAEVGLNYPLKLLALPSTCQQTETTLEFSFVPVSD